MRTNPAKKVRQVLYGAGIVFAAAFLRAYATGR